MATVNPVADETPAAADRLDPESAEWLGALNGKDPQREAALARLHGMLLRIAQRECRRRSPRQRQVFVAIVVNAVPLDALVIELSSNRNGRPSGGTCSPHCAAPWTPSCPRGSVRCSSRSWSTLFRWMPWS